MSDWATSGRIKIDRAEKHVRHLESEIAAFKKLSPYHVFRDLESQRDPTNAIIYRVRVVEDIPPEWGAIAADAIHNLHVALDYLWRRAIKAPPAQRKVYFPALESPQEAKARFEGKVKGSMKIAVDILNAADAFRLNNPFWQIRQFDVADKHHSMVLAACQIQGYVISIGAVARVPVELRPDEWRILEDNAELFTAVHWYGKGEWTSPIYFRESVWENFRSIAQEMNVSTDLAFEITFGEGEVLKRHAVVKTIQDFTQAVDGLATAFIDNGLIK